MMGAPLVLVKYQGEMYSGMKMLKNVSTGGLLEPQKSLPRREDRGEMGNCTQSSPLPSTSPPTKKNAKGAASPLTNDGPRRRLPSFFSDGRSNFGWKAISRIESCACEKADGHFFPMNFESFHFFPLVLGPKRAPQPSESIWQYVWRHVSIAWLKEQKWARAKGERNEYKFCPFSPRQMVFLFQTPFTRSFHS